MSDPDFRKLVAEMRRAQKNYFASRDSRTLQESKQLEARVDRELEPAGRTLFDQEPAR